MRREKLEEEEEEEERVERRESEGYMIIGLEGVV